MTTRIGDKFQIQVRRRGDYGVKQFTVMALEEGLTTAGIKQFIIGLLEACIYPDDDGAITCDAPIMVIRRLDENDKHKRAD